MSPSFLPALLLFLAAPAAAFATESPDAEPPVALPAEPTATPADPWSWSFETAGVFRNWLDNTRTPTKEDYLDGMNRLYGVATRPDVELGVQVDVVAAWPNDRAGLISERTPPPGWTTGMFFDSDEAVRGNLEKKFLRVRRGAVALEAGDTYRALGRGLALAVTKNTELDIDTSIEGGSADVQLGDHFEVGAWGGWSNPQSISTTFPNRLRRDARDVLGGGRLGLRGEGVEIFGFGNTIAYDDRQPGQVFLGPTLVTVHDATVGGAGISLPDLAGVADLYLEGDWVRYEVSREGARREAAGRGFYGAGTIYLGRLTLQVEGKHYQNLEVMNVRQSEGTAAPYDYSTPPTLEKENLVNYNTSHAVNSNDVSGGRLTGSWRMGKQIARLTYARFEDRGQRGDLYDANESIHHAYAGIERRAGGSFGQVTAGVRYETRLKDPDVHDVQYHLDADVLVPVFGLPFEAKYLVYRQVEQEPISGHRRTYDVNQIIASVHPVRWLTVAALLDTTTDAAVISGFGGREGNLSKYAFGAVELSVEPTDATLARVFVGATQGGLKCSGGTCRVVPAFEGFRLEWLARF